MKNALTIDLEEHFHATAFSTKAIPEGGSGVSRVEQNTQRLLEVLANKGSVATFFVVGSIADKLPRLIRDIARAGHELACHSHSHREVFRLTRDQFCEDTRRAKSAIEDATGTRVQGYRAPSFSIRRDTVWAFSVLVEMGFSYDSSIFPIRHLNFEMQTAPRGPFVVITPAGPLLEFPMTTLQILRERAPLAGGAYLRLLPYWYTRWGIRYLNRAERRSACVYIHPWELDPGQPKMKGDLTARLRHYSGLRGARAKLERLLDDFEFEPLRSQLDGFGGLSSCHLNPSLPQIQAANLCSHARS